MLFVVDGHVQLEQISNIIEQAWLYFLVNERSTLSSQDIRVTFSVSNFVRVPLNYAAVRPILR